MRIYLLLLLVIYQSTTNVAFAKDLTSNLITPASYFVNHVSLLSKIKHNLIKYKKTSVVGISGIGKTQLVRMYGYENKEKYNIIWFIDCNLDLNEQLLKLVKAINQKDKSVKLSEDLLFIKQQIMDYLTTKKDWLLIFDNLKVGQNEKVQEFIQWENNGHIIFCSQEIHNLPNVLKVNRFTPNDIKILSKKILEEQNEYFIDFLVKELDGYPLLIVQGAQLLNNIKGLEYEEYKKRILIDSDKILTNIKLVLNKLTPTARELLNIIALINNQEFSKRFLKEIIQSTSSLDDDIYQLSKFGLIHNIFLDESNSVFEMHDIVSNKLLGLNGNLNAKYLENIISKVIMSMPKDIIQGYNYRNEQIVRENLEVILKNAEAYNINLKNTMILRLELLKDYLNTYNYHKSSQMIGWFTAQNQEKLLKTMSASSEAKNTYSEYLACIGHYYKRRYLDYKGSKDWLFKALKVSNQIDGYNLPKSNLYYNIALDYIGLGKIDAAEKYIKKVELLLNNGKVEEKYRLFEYIAKANMFLLQGKNNKALEQIELALTRFFTARVNPNDLLLTQTYLVRGIILNNLERYSDANEQLKHLGKMYESRSYGENHNIWGRIFLQKARSAFGLGKKSLACKYVNKAIKILNIEENVPDSHLEIFINPELAQAYALRGDLEFKFNNIKEALSFYTKAHEIYFYLYKENSKNIEIVSNLYLSGAKAACKDKNLYFYRAFGKHQIEEFGLEHYNTKLMLTYCKKHNMNLWEEEN